MELEGSLIKSNGPEMNTGNSGLCNSKCFYYGDRSITCDSKTNILYDGHLNKVLHGKKQ